MSQTLDQIVQEAQEKERVLQVVKDNVGVRIKNIKTLVEGFQNSEKKEFFETKLEVISDLSRIEEQIHSLLEMR